MQHMCFALLSMKYRFYGKTMYSVHILYQFNCCCDVYCLAIVGMVTIAEKECELEFAFPWDLFIGTRNGDDKHTTIVRCSNDSLLRPQASFVSHKTSMQILMGVS